MNMDMQEIRQTDIWTLYDKAVSYGRQMGMFADTDVNYRMYNGDQWYGLKVKGIEKVQLNFIKPIVRYKVGIILSNLYAVNFSSENFENRAFRKNAEKICKLLNKKASKIWERDYMDMKLRMVVKDAAINDEGVVYVFYEDGQIVNEIINKTDIFYGDENHSNLQSQPYILIKQRKSVSEVQEIAARNGLSEEKIQYILGDKMDLTDEAGEDAKYEKDDMCTVVTKLYKYKGTVYFAQATRYVDLKEDTNTGLTYYPAAHLLWEERKGSARGEGEVRHLIPNQLETNKTAMRRAITVKSTAFPQKIIDKDKIQNPGALEKSGATINVSGGSTVDDVSKMISYLNPAQMSTDVEKLQKELIESTRELAGAGDIATGQVNPSDASGRAILAVQQASQQPLTEHLEYTKAFVEDLARIWLDMLTTYEESIELEDDVVDPQTGEETTQLVKIPQMALRELQAKVKVDITPRGAFDKYAQEQSMENLLTGGLLTPQRLPELKIYVKMLPDDSVMPKPQLEDAIKYMEAEQKKIAQISAEGQMMKQRVQQFLGEDMDAQAKQLAENAMQEQAEEEVIEDNPDDN